MKQFANTAPTAEELVDAVEKNMTSSKVPEDYMYYAQNEFKRFMGYVEPDYLRVAGLYASTEWIEVVDSCSATDGVEKHKRNDGSEARNCFED